MECNCDSTTSTSSGTLPDSRSNLGSVLHIKHPVIKLVREQLKSAEVLGDKLERSLTENSPVTVSQGCNTTALPQQDNTATSDSSLGSRAGDNKKLLIGTVLLVTLMALVLVYGAIIGAELCGSIPFRRQFSSQCNSIKFIPGLNILTNNLYTRSVF